MFACSHSPDTLTPQELDRFLAAGWFRMGPHIFTTNFLNFNNQFYSAFWLRVNLQEYSADRTFDKLKKRNAGFRVTIQPACITPQQEELFVRYSESVPFRTSSSLMELLFGKGVEAVYNTYEVTIHDGDKLIGVGFFDLGYTSAAGISSFYDPAYKKYSLGKYMIYLKMEFCKQRQHHYFYPGYVVPGYAAFDYKLTIGTSNLQFFDVVSSSWLSADQLPAVTPLQHMKDKLTELQQMFQDIGVKSVVMYYEFFDAVLIPELQDAGVLDYPVFLTWVGINENNLVTVVVYDLLTGNYKLIRTYTVWKSEQLPVSDSIFNTYMLRPVMEVFECTHAQDVIHKLISVTKQNI